MVGRSVQVEDAAAPVANAKLTDGLDSVELSAETYEKLRRLAAEYLRSERAGHTLQPTALLHEAFLRVLKQPDHAWRDEAHVIAFAARAMRRILISYGVARTVTKEADPQPYDCPWMKLSIFVLNATLILARLMKRLKSSNARTRDRHKLLNCGFSPVSRSTRSHPLLRYHARQ